MQPVSVYFITKNEELRLEDALCKVVDWADEVIVVDSGSTDGTEAIVRRYGARFEYHAWQGFAVQKAYAASLCRNAWVLDLDADEVLSDALVQNIRTLFSRPISSDTAGFKMRWVLSQPQPGHPFQHDKPKKILRLYNRNKAEIVSEPDSNDDRPKVREGKVRFIAGDVLHRTLVSLEQMERKYLQLSTEQAHYLARKGRKISTARLAVEFPVKFLKYYLVHRQVLNGWYGFSVSIVAANRNYMRLAKAREIQMLKSLSVVRPDHPPGRASIPHDDPR